MGAAIKSRSQSTNADLAYRLLRGALAEGHYRSGERLGEVAVATTLGMSRTPVRQALQRLRSDGLVIRTGQGLCAVVLDRTAIADLYALRVTIEALASATAARRQATGLLPPADLERLEGAAAAFEDLVATGDVREAVGANLEFHRTIAELADNAFVIDALGQVWERIAIASFENLSDLNWADEVIRQHAEIVASIEAADPGRAAELTRAHVAAAADICRFDHAARERPRR